MRRQVGLITTALVSALTLTACAGGQSQDDLQAAPTLLAATPAASPPATAQLPGTVLPLPGPASAIVVDATTHTAAIAVTKPARLLLFATDDLAKPPRVVALPGPVEHLSLRAAGGPVLAPVASANKVLQVAIPSGTVTSIPVPGGPTSAALFDGHLLVAVPARKAIDQMSGDTVTRAITGDVNPDQVLVSDGDVVMLDRIRSAVFDVNAVNGTVGAGLRAGQGATNAAIDTSGRVIVTDTRTGQVMSFTTNPVVERQAAPVAGVPYGIAVDPTRQVAWVTSTQLNEVLGYQLAGGQPVQKYRLSTVRQPDSVAVDPVSGQVFVASADGGGVQVMQP